MDSETRQFVEILNGAFEAAGFELYVVGGALRDELLQRPVTEVDLTTNARPDEIVRTIEPIPGLSPYSVGAKFGTIGAVVHNQRGEITTFRSGEKYESGSRKPEVEFGGSILDDLGRRDFTVNAMALPAGFASDAGRKSLLIDPYFGRTDLQGRLIRAVGDPGARFDEDPLRLLRAVRFAASLNFRIEEQTWSAVKASAPRLEEISRERVFDELTKMLTGVQPSRALTLLREGGLMQVAVPRLMELDAMRDHGPRHPLSLWDHTLRVVDAVVADPETRWAALLHDIGKPSTRSFDPDGRIRFSHHEEVGAKASVEILQSLHAGNHFTQSVALLVSTHMQLHGYSDSWSDGAVRRLSMKLDGSFDRAIDLARADAQGHGDTSWGASKIGALEQRAAELSKRVPKVGSPLSGSELMARYSRPAGPWLRVVKDALTNEVVEGTLSYDDKESARKRADRIVADLKS